MSRGLQTGPDAAHDPHRMANVFDKSPALFPIRRSFVYLSHCAIGPMYAPAAAAMHSFIDAQSERGLAMLARYSGVLDSFREKAAAFLRTGPENVAYVSNTAAGMNFIANGYPFEPGDQVISYVHEFPSNHYPWILQKRRGVDLVLLSDVDPIGDLAARGPRGWSMDELEEKTTSRTRVIALSHVQYTSGYAADLKRLGDFCKARDIDLVVDAAQSLGALPVHPEEHGIAAMPASTWKFLLASRGAGLLYTSPRLRAKLEPTVVGGAMMKQGLDYLNHDWDPLESGRRFEYSTLPWEHLLAIESVLDGVFLRYGIEAVSREILRLQDTLIAALDTGRVRPLVFSTPHRSGILSVLTERDPGAVVEYLREEGVLATSQGGWVRIAPHFYLTDDDMEKVASVLGRVA